MRRKTMLRAAFLILAVVLLVITVAQQRDALADSLTTVSIRALALAAVFVLVGLLAQMLSWRSLFGGRDGAAPAVRTAGHIYFVGQLGKYVPGSVWAVVAQAELGRDHRIPRARSAVVALGTVVVIVVTGAAVASAGLVAGSQESLEAYWWALLSIPAGTILLAPPVFNRLVRMVLRLLRRETATATLTGPAVLRSAGWSTVMWLAFGMHAWILASALGVRGWSQAATVAGAFALAWVVGFLVILAPAGAGPREAALVLALAPVMDTARALALALLSRVLMVLGDAVAAAVFARRRAPAAVPSEEA